MPTPDPSARLALWKTGIAAGDIVPILGPDSQTGSADAEGRPLPAQGRDLILAMTGGQPLSPKLMAEFSRAAMNLEFKRGRKFIERCLAELYETRAWSASPQMRWIAAARPRYVIDLNRDSVLLDLFADTPHLLIQGVARLSKADPRYRAFRREGGAYRPVDEAAEGAALAELPVVFKPLGCARPTASFIASDADYVDFITELMGGFALPPFLKARRTGKRYLIAGVRLAKDTERMIVRDLVYGADAAGAGWLVADAPTPKETRFAAQLGFEVLDAPLSAFWP